MSLIPSGQARQMKGQMVRSCFRADLSPLLKLAQVAPPNRSTIEQEDISMGSEGGTPQPTEAPEAIQSQPQPQEPQPSANPQAQQMINKPNGGDQQQPKDPEQEKQENRSEVLKRREEVRQYLDSEGLQFDMQTSAETLRVTVKLKPHVQAEDDKAWYPADQVMAPVVEKMFNMGFDVTEPTPAQAHRRVIDPKAQPVQYIFTFSPQKNQQKEMQDGGYTIPRRPRNGTPVQSRPNSAMGQVPPAKAASSETMPEILAAGKDHLVEALKKILGGK